MDRSLALPSKPSDNLPPRRSEEPAQACSPDRVKTTLAAGPATTTLTAEPAKVTMAAKQAKATMAAEPAKATMAAEPAKAMLAAEPAKTTLAIDQAEPSNSPGHAEAKLAIKQAERSKPQDSSGPFGRTAKRAEHAEQMMKLLDPVASSHPTARILICPKVDGLKISPYGEAGSYENWVNVDMKHSSSGTGAGAGAGETIKVLVVAQSAKQIGCTISYDTVCFRLYFDPAFDRLILHGSSDNAISVKQPKDTFSRRISFGGDVALSLGFWSISTDGRSLVELQVLPRPDYLVSAPQSIKRAAQPSGESSPIKRTKLGEAANQAMAPPQAPQALALAPNNALVVLGQGETIHVGEPGEDRYRLTQYLPIANQKHSSVWSGEHSDMKDEVIVVKVLKAGSSHPSDTVGVADRWMRELALHSRVTDHVRTCIVTRSHSRRGHNEEILTRVPGEHSVLAGRRCPLPLSRHRIRRWRFAGRPEAAGPGRGFQWG